MNQTQNEQQNWLSKHGDTVIIMIGLLASFVWMNMKFSELENRSHEVDKRLIRIETVMIMNKIMPESLAVEGVK